ncbi:MAG: helix-turn-helix domain-containing protein [Planctomycetaceae bacterium]|nr:helix-turn-helix domain-containing protein [Planctomycetaceae bacterium]
MRTDQRQPTEAKLLRVEQVADRLGVSARTVWRLCSCGQLAKPLPIGRCRRWRKLDVDNFVESLRKV